MAETKPMKPVLPDWGDALADTTIAATCCVCGQLDHPTIKELRLCLAKLRESSRG
jgi:ribosomal protein S14